MENSDIHNRPDREKHYYAIVDMHTGRTQWFDFPRVSNGERRTAYGLRRLDNGNVEPYYISQLKDGRWHLRLP